MLVALLISAAQNRSLEEIKLKKSSQAGVLKAPKVCISNLENVQVSLWDKLDRKYCALTRCGTLNS